jgi:hypothetical protein
MLLLVAACGGGANEAKTATADDLRLQLWKPASDVLDESHAVLDDDARRELRDFVEQGATRLAEDHASAEAVRTAEGQVRTLARDIVAQAHRNTPGDKGVIEVLERDVKAIRNKVCPFYPFCR